MKGLGIMKKKKLILVGATSLTLVIAIISTALILSKPKERPKTEPLTSQIVTVEKPEDILKPDVISKPDIPETEKIETTQPKTPDTVIEVDNKKEADKNIIITPAETTEKPVVTTAPPQPDNNTGGINIVGENIEKYNCDVANHHCDGPETHAYISNLELDGCPYCGSHSCSSFYATDEWGNACYTPSKCPKYDITKDSAEYCLICGKKNGDGNNDTCQKWIVDFVCSICGELVPANECHTH